MLKGKAQEGFRAIWRRRGEDSESERKKKMNLVSWDQVLLCGCAELDLNNQMSGVDERYWLGRCRLEHEQRLNFERETNRRQRYQICESFLSNGVVILGALYKLKEKIHNTL